MLKALVDEGKYSNSSFCHVRQQYCYKIFVFLVLCWAMIIEIRGGGLDYMLSNKEGTYNTPPA